MKGAGYYNLMVQQIYVLKGRRQGKALKFMLKLLELSKTLGFTGVELNQAASPAGEQLLRKLVRDHGWCTNGKVPEKKEAQILNVHDQPIPNDERVTEFDDLYGCEAIDSVHDLGPWLDRVRKNGGMLNGGPNGVCRQFIIGKEIYVLLRWSRVQPHTSAYIKQMQQYAEFVDSVYSPFP